MPILTPQLSYILEFNLTLTLTFDLTVKYLYQKKNHVPVCIVKRVDSLYTSALEKTDWLGVIKSLFKGSFECHLRNHRTLGQGEQHPWYTPLLY